MLGNTPREESTSSLVLLLAFCFFSFAAVWITPLPPDHSIAQIYLRYFTGILVAASCWCTIKEWKSGKPLPRLGPILWPLLCVGLAAWLRFRNLTLIDTWQDEDHQLSGVLVRNNIVAFSASIEQAPLDFFNTYLMLNICGVSLFSARLMPAILGSLAVIPFYRLLRNFVREESAILGAIFFLGNTLLWSLSQEGRPYMAAGFLLVISLQMWVAFYRNPKKRHLWVGFVVAQAALFLTLAMQPQFAFGFYFIPLVILTLAGNRMRLREYAAAVLLSGILALPVMISAAFQLPEVAQIQPLAAGFLADYWPTMVEVTSNSLGSLLWGAPLLLIALFLKGRDGGSQALGKSLLSLAIIYPFLFFFCFEAVLSTPVKPRYITFYVVFYIFALTYSLDRLAPVKGYKYFAAACAILFLGNAVEAESVKEREPVWRQFFEYVSKNESSSGVGAVLDFPLNWPFPLQGFRGALLYAGLYKNKLSLRSNSERTASATGDLIRRLEENPKARFAYLLFPANDQRDNLLFHLKFPHSPERKNLKLEHANALRLEPKDGSLARAIREALLAAKELDPRVAQNRGYLELMSGLYALENKCDSAMQYWPKLSRDKLRYFHRETYDYLKSLLAQRCKAR